MGATLPATRSGSRALKSAQGKGQVREAGPAHGLNAQHALLVAACTSGWRGSHAWRAWLQRADDRCPQRARRVADLGRRHQGAPLREAEGVEAKAERERSHRNVDLHADEPHVQVVVVVVVGWGGWGVGGGGGGGVGAVRAGFCD